LAIGTILIVSGGSENRTALGASVGPGTARLSVRRSFH